MKHVKHASVVVSTGGLPDLTGGLVQGVSAAVGVVCLVTAVLAWTVGKRHTPRLVVLLVMTGTAGLINTALGRWARAGIGWINTAMDRVTGQLTGVVVVGLFAAVAVYVLVIHWRHRSISRETLAAAAVAPLAVATIPGPVGAFAFGVVSAVTGVVGWGVAALFGLH